MSDDTAKRGRKANPIPPLGKLNLDDENLSRDTLAMISQHLSALADYATIRHDAVALRAEGDTAAAVGKETEADRAYRMLYKPWRW